MLKRNTFFINLLILLFIQLTILESFACNNYSDCINKYNALKSMPCSTVFECHKLAEEIQLVKSKIEYFKHSNPYKNLGSRYALRNQNQQIESSTQTNNNKYSQEVGLNCLFYHKGLNLAEGQQKVDFVPKSFDKDAECLLIY